VKKASREKNSDQVLQKRQIGFCARVCDLSHARVLDQTALGRMVAAGTTGGGLVRDRAAAACLFRQAAEGGGAEAQFLLGATHAVGDGVAHDRGQARMWFHRAADQGHWRARIRS
jgi:TPR repeat protein